MLVSDGYCLGCLLMICYKDVFWWLLLDGLQMERLQMKRCLWQKIWFTDGLMVIKCWLLRWYDDDGVSSIAEKLWLQNGGISWCYFTGKSRGFCQNDQLLMMLVETLAIILGKCCSMGCLPIVFVIDDENGVVLAQKWMLNVPKTTRWWGMCA